MMGVVILLGLKIWLDGNLIDLGVALSNFIFCKD